jgi:hypothetical protein
LLPESSQQLPTMLQKMQQQLSQLQLVMHQQQAQPALQQQARGPEQVSPTHWRHEQGLVHSQAGGATTSAAVAPRARQRVAPLKPVSIQDLQQQQRRSYSPMQSLQQAAAAAVPSKGRLQSSTGNSASRAGAAVRGATSASATAARVFSPQRAAAGDLSRHTSSRASSPTGPLVKRGAAGSRTGSSPPQGAARLQLRPAAAGTAGVPARQVAEGQAAAAGGQVAPLRGLQALQQHRWQQRLQVCVLPNHPVWLVYLTPTFATYISRLHTYVFAGLSHII